MSSAAFPSTESVVISCAINYNRLFYQYALSYDVVMSLIKFVATESACISQKLKRTRVGLEDNVDYLTMHICSIS